MIRREPLQANAIEEPRRVRRYVRRLIGPVVEVVIAPQADVAEEDAGLQVDAAVRIAEVIAAVGLRDVAIHVGELPLAARRAGVVARRGRRELAELGHHPTLYVVDV